MIQRIQSVFLLIATVILVFVATFPFAEFVRATDQVIFELGFMGLTSDNINVEVEFSTLPLTILIALSLLITFVTSVLNIVLLLGLEGLMFYYIKASQSVLNADVSYKLFFVFPLVAAILVFLALRGIARDEALIRSLDRLR